MSNSLPQVFNFTKTSQFPVRTIIKDDEIWFVAADVCKVLEHSDVSMAVSRLDEDEKLIQTLFVSGQNRQTWMVSESGLYHLIFTSRKEEAKVFRRWVTNEVLPAIRKTGSYSANEKGIAITDTLDSYSLDKKAGISDTYIRSETQLLHPQSTRQSLSPADEQELILLYVKRLETPTAREVGRYLTRYPVTYLRQRLHDLALRGLLIEWFTGHSYRYKAVKP